MALHRRRLLELCGTTTAVGLAGCLGDSMPGEDDPTHEHVSDGTVDYPGMVDGGASVTADQYVTIEYDDPQTSFILQPIYEGQEASEDQFRIQRDLSGDTMAGFIAPVHTGETFEYHVFANESFVEFADWNVVTGAGQDLTDAETPGFERLQGPVYGMVLSPGEAELLAVVDTTAEELQSRDGPSPTGLAIIKGASGGQPEQSAPQISFGFEYDSASEQLTVTHEGGDSVEASRLEIRSNVEITVDDGFEGTVAAGDAATVTAPSDAEVRVIWTSAEGDTSATLASWTGPDA
jgi:hypothetical protein